MSNKKIPTDLRAKLEAARLEALAISRALDSLNVALADLPPAFNALFELDADFAEALWALDQPPKALNFGAMVKDTLASLQLWPRRVNAFLSSLSPATQAALTKRVPAVQATLELSDAYNGVPGANHRFR